MKRGTWAKLPDIFVRESLHGVITAKTLRGFEMDNRTIYRRCLPGGIWRRLLPGIILLQNSQPTQQQRVTAALLYTGENAVITGSEACRLHGLRPSQLPTTEQLHVLIPHKQRTLSSEFVTIERTIRMPVPVMIGDVPTAPLNRAVLDTARRLRAADPIAKMLIEAVQRGGCSPTALLREVNDGSPRGTAIPRRILREISDLRSIAEFDGRKLVGRMKKKPTHWNAVICGPAGDYLGRPDAWWDDVAMVWEIDSREFHFYAEDYARTLRRNTRYAELGITVVQTLPSRIRDEPDKVLAELEAAYQAAALRPRPPVQVRPEAA
jgi:hypothetical protein